MLSLDNDNFQKEVLDEKACVLVDFWSEGCSPCKALMPHIEELSNKYGHKIKFCKLDTIKSRRLAIKEKILGLPAIAIYREGLKLEEISKEDANKENIENMIKKYI